MKGPRSRSDLDVRRVWECPRCGRRTRAEGEVTAKRCSCAPEGTWMRLVEDRRHVRDPFQLRDPLSGTGGSINVDEGTASEPAAELANGLGAETITPAIMPTEEPQPGASVPPPHAVPPHRDRDRRRPNRRGRDNPNS